MISQTLSMTLYRKHSRDWQVSQDSHYWCKRRLCKDMWSRRHSSQSYLWTIFWSQGIWVTL